MIDVPYEEAVRRIAEGSGLSLEEVETRIGEKLAQLSGLVSREGAAHILANELGVQLVRPAPAGGTTVTVAEVTVQSRNITVTGRVVQKYEERTFSRNGRDGRVASLLLGDGTGIVRVVFWNDQVDAFKELNPGDTLQVRNPFVKPNLQGRPELQLNTQSSITVNPEGIIIPEVTRQERAAATQRYIKDLEGGEENVEVIATIVQVFDPRFFDACPQCNRKLNANLCPEHGEVTPGINWSLSLVLDDGTGNIRTTFWKQQSLRLTGKTESEFLAYKDDPLGFEDVKNALLGEFVKVIGRMRKNEQFDRLELTANLVFLDVDPALELEKLEKKFDAAKTTVTEKSTVKEQGNVVTASEEFKVVEDDVVSLDDLEDLEK